MKLKDNQWCNLLACKCMWTTAQRRHKLSFNLISLNYYERHTGVASVSLMMTIIAGCSSSVLRTFPSPPSVGRCRSTTSWAMPTSPQWSIPLPSHPTSCGSPARSRSLNWSSRDDSSHRATAGCSSEFCRCDSIGCRCMLFHWENKWVSSPFLYTVIIFRHFVQGLYFWW